jgi:predicted ATPase
MNSIKTLTIKGFKSIQSVEQLPLNPLNILIGANGVGKSNFVSYFKMLGELVEGRLKIWTSKQGGADRILSYGVKETTQLTSSIAFNNSQYDIELVATVEGSFTFSTEQFTANDTPHDFGSGHNETKLPSSTNINAEHWKVFHFHDTSDTAGVKRLSSLHDNDYLRTDASNLAAFLYRLKNKAPDVYRQMIKTIRLAVPLFADFVLKPITLESGEQQIRLLWQQTNSDYALWPSQLSDGSIRFICLVTALMQPAGPATIIIDEPELGLHPYAITLLGALIRSASKRMQVIISTQSVPLLNEFSMDDLIVVERQKGATTFKRLSEADFTQWLEEYSVGELWEKNILGGQFEGALTRGRPAA